MEKNTFFNRARELFTTYCKKCGVDRAVFFGFLTRIIGFSSGTITAILIASKFSPEVQGYYYTFLNLLVAQVFIELGFSTVLIQLAGHEWSKLSIDENGEISGDSNALSRLTSIAQITFRWFFAGSIVFVLILGTGGYLFFSRISVCQVSWALPWLTLVILTAVNMLIMPAWSLLEGCNQVINVYTYRFIQIFLSSLTLWISILLGAGLWTPSFSSAVVIICSLIFLKSTYWKFLKTLIFTRQDINHVNWWVDIFPFQWRIALSWISGFLSFNLFTPVLLHYQGAAIAGQMGMTWSIASMIGLAASSWVYPRVPTFCILIAQNKYRELDELFYKITKMVVIVTFTITATIWALIYLLDFINHPIARRLLPLRPATFVLIGQALQTMTIPASSYLRAHKKEPLLLLSMVSALLLASTVFYAGKYYSAYGISLGYLIISIILNPWVFIIWYRCRMNWHRDENP